MRNFLPQDLSITSWEQIQTYFEDLKNRTIGSASDLKKWMQDRSELEAVLEEDMAWRYIKMNIDTTDEDLQKSFQFFVEKISPNTAPYDHGFNTKLVESPFLKDLDQETYFIYLRSVENDIKLYREENIPLFTELTNKSQKFGEIAAQMLVTIDGEEKTLQQASVYLKGTDREKRKEAFEKVNARRVEDKEELDILLDELIQKRQEVAKNANFENFRDYKFQSMGRFDYTKEDCFNFHESIAQEIVPLIADIQKERKANLGLAVLKPWDMSVDPNGNQPLKPFEGGEELLDKCIECFDKVRPYYGACLRKMKEMGHLDLVSRKGKAPGGFMYPLYESGVPFIYMNSVGLLRDAVTMVHEGGHAIHSFYTKDMELTAFKSTPSEVAELASMSMELISMEHWDVFFGDKEEWKRARKEQLQGVLETLPWVAMVDEFQHWLYENGNHTQDERHDKWLSISKRYGTGMVDWSSHKEFQKTAWQRQLHIYEVPFYYIEYGMAQLGAIAVWRNYKQNSEKALDDYDSALKLGYTKSIGEIYEAANVKFDFSASYVKELADFVKSELEALKSKS
ncbi:MAG: M3 family oligoendopeptidase [Flavobacteriales bacterium]|jgi:oligoendopeptidase F